MFGKLHHHHHHNGYEKYSDLVIVSQIVSHEKGNEDQNDYKCFVFDGQKHNGSTDNNSGNGTDNPFKSFFSGSTVIRLNNNQQSQCNPVAMVDLEEFENENREGQTESDAQRVFELLRVYIENFPDNLKDNPRL
ncbi:hypothetical protein D3C80_1150680 [compost metagenome]